MATRNYEPNTFSVACLAWNGGYCRKSVKAEATVSQPSTTTCPVFETHHLHQPSTLNKFCRNLCRWLARHAPLMGEIKGRLSDMEDEERMMNEVREEVASFPLECQSLEVIHESYIASLPICTTYASGTEPVVPVLGLKTAKTVASMKSKEAPLPSESVMIPLEATTEPVPAVVKAETVKATVAPSVPKVPGPKVVNIVNPRIINDVRVALVTKHGFVSDTAVNRLLIDKSARKIMKENHFRDNVVATHLEFINNAFFECRVEQAKAGGSRRKCSNWLLRFLGFSTKKTTGQ